MSTVSISYSSLKDASSEAKSVAKKLDKCADSVKKDIYNKLNSYGGTWTSNITTARNNVNSKVSELRGLADKYERYADDLIGLRDECKRTDESVKKKVSTLTATFKVNHGISNSRIQNTFNYFITSVGNSTAAGRWIGDGEDKLDAVSDYFKESIEDWYEFEGGEDFLKGATVAALEIAIAVITVIGAVATLIVGGTVLAMIVTSATLIGGIIAGVNGITNLINEGRALNHTMNNDPATGKRKSAQDTLTDTIRTESDSKLAHNIANGIDVVNEVCGVICSIASIASGFGDILKKGYKWTTGCTDELKNINLRNLFKEGNFGTFAGKLKTVISTGWTDVKVAVITGNKSFFKEVVGDFSSDLLNNIKGNYLDFSTTDKKINSVVNIFEDVIELEEDGINFGNIVKIIAVPNIPVADLPFTSGVSGDGISVGDFTDLYGSFKSVVLDSFIFTDDSLIDTDILEKLSKKSNVKVAIPEIYIPTINIPKLKVV